MHSKLLALLLLLPSLVWAAPAPDLPDGWTDGFVYANGIRIHYYHANPAPGKPVVVAIHGVMDTGLTWVTVGQMLEKDYDVYTVDARGHGLTDAFKGDEAGGVLVEDAAAFVRALGFEKPILVGHSMGSATVMHVGAKYPDLARAIVMLDPNLVGRRPSPARTGAPAPGEAAAVPIGPRPPTAPSDMHITMAGSPEVLVAQNNYRFDDLTAKAHHDNPKWSRTDCLYWAVAIKRYHGPYAQNAWDGLFSSLKTEEALAKIQVPALILKADAPPDVRKANEEAAKVMQHGKLLHIDGAAHNIHRDRPEQTYEALVAFFSTLR